MNLDRSRAGQIAARLAWQGSHPVDARSGVELRQRLLGQGRNALTAAAQTGLAGATRVIRRALRIAAFRMALARQLGTASRRGPGRSILPCPQAAAERLRAGEHQHAEEHRQSAQKGSHDNLILRSRQVLVQLDSVKWDLRRTLVGISQRTWKTGEGHGEPTTASRLPMEMGGSAERVLGRELSDSLPIAGARRSRKMTHWRAVLIDRHKNSTRLRSRSMSTVRGHFAVATMNLREGVALCPGYLDQKFVYLFRASAGRVSTWRAPRNGAPPDLPSNELGGPLGKRCLGAGGPAGAHRERALDPSGSRTFWRAALGSSDCKAAGRPAQRSVSAGGDTPSVTWIGNGGTRRAPPASSGRARGEAMVWCPPMRCAATPALVPVLRRPIVLLYAK